MKSYIRCPSRSLFPPFRFQSCLPSACFSHPDFNDKTFDPHPTDHFFGELEFPNSSATERYVYYSPLLQRPWSLEIPSPSTPARVTSNHQIRLMCSGLYGSCSNLCLDVYTTFLTTHAPQSPVNGSCAMMASRTPPKIFCSVIFILSILCLFDANNLQLHSSGSHGQGPL